MPFIFCETVFDINHNRLSFVLYNRITTDCSTIEAFIEISYYFENYMKEIQMELVDSNVFENTFIQKIIF